MGTVLEVKDIHKSLGGGERLLKGGGHQIKVQEPLISKKIRFLFKIRTLV